MLFSLKSLFSEIWSSMNSDWSLGPGASRCEWSDEYNLTVRLVKEIRSFRKLLIFYFNWIWSLTLVLILHRSGSLKDFSGV